MRYFGSKASTVERIYEMASSRVPAGLVCDPFGGIGTVGSYFKKKGYTVWCGDSLRFAHAFQTARVELDKLPKFTCLLERLRLPGVKKICAHLSGLQPVSGWVTKHYAKRRRFFTPQNARMIDACRGEVERWRQEGCLSWAEYCVLIASLIDSMDRVANTAGTYYAFLKDYYRKALQAFRFELICPVPGAKGCRSFLCDAMLLVGRRAYDIVYLDPPYNERSYARYYHLPESIAWGTTPAVVGSCGMPVRHLERSEFNNPVRATEALARLLGLMRFRLLVFHYCDQGLVSPPAVRSILKRHGTVVERLLTAPGYTTSSKQRRIKNRVYLVMND